MFSAVCGQGLYKLSNCISSQVSELQMVLQIGTVFASEKYICPNAVGVDIGQSQLTVAANVVVMHYL